MDTDDSMPTARSKPVKPNAPLNAEGEAYLHLLLVIYLIDEKRYEVVS